MFDRKLMRRSILSFASILGIGALGLAPSALADSAPATRAARLTYMQGTVTVTWANNTAPAQMNLPLLAGVRLATGQDGQAEVEFEDGSVARLTPNSTLSLDNLSVDPGGVFVTGVSLLQGLAYFELRAAPQYRYSINAGGDILSPVENTTVRVNFDEPPAIFSVLDGTAQVERQTGPDGTASGAGYETDVRAGESLRGDPADPTRYFLTQEIAEDSWDQWNEDRDQAAAAAAANGTDVRDNYAGAQGYGWSDLDANGSWYDVPDQGQVWQPTIAADAGFDPYGYGEWVWYPATGYVWASGYAWGWTPYRCGTWSYYNSFGWGWVPGAGCGGLGWGFAGGGLLVNVGFFPRGYRPIRVPVAGPVAGPHPQRPILPVRTYIPPVRAVSLSVAQAGPRQIAGVTAVPIRPTGNSYVPVSGAMGASLRRDFPVDSATHVPVLGLASTRPAVVHTATGWQSPPATPAARPAAATRPSTPSPAYTNPGYSGQSRPAPATPRAPTAPGAPYAPSAQRAPTAPGAPYAPSAPRTPSAPQAPRAPQTSAPVQRSSPPRPTYTPPPPPPPPPAHTEPAPSHNPR
jgi:hypothetical protein